MNTILAKLASVVIAPFILIGGLFSPDPIAIPQAPVPVVENQAIPVGGGSGTIEKLPQLITSKDEGTTLTSRTASFDFVGAGVSSSNVGNAVTVTISGGGGGGGTDVALDLGDNGSNESSAISEIAITGDTNSIFTEPSSDKLLIALANDWPKADVSDLVTFADAGGDTTTFVALGTSATGNLSPATDAGLSYNATTNALTATTFIGGLTGNASTATALAANGANCSAGSAPLGVDASGAVESCTDFEEDLSNSAGLLAALSDETGTGLSVFNDAPTFTTRIILPEIKASGSAGVDIHNNSGTQIALFGAGGSTGTSLVGTTNIGSASTDYLQIAGGTGSTTLTAIGGSTNVDITLTPKGSGVVNTNILTLTGTGTLNGLDVIDATGEATLESTLDLVGDVSSTGLSTTVIGADKVLESMLKAVDTASDEECLTYESTAGDFEWQACGGGGGGTPGGSDTQIQFNDGGSFGGDAGLVYDKTTDALTLAGIFSAPTLTLTGTGTINGLDSIDATTETTLEGAIDIAGDVSGTGLTAVTIGADKVLESMLKAVDAASDEECLTYESTVGDFEWQTCGGGGSPGGSDTQIQFNNAGAFDGDAGLTWNSTNNQLAVIDTTLTTTQSLSIGALLENTTAATVGAQKISPALRLSGKGWKTTATAASQDVSFLLDVLPVQGTTNPTGNLQFHTSINGGAITKLAQIGSDGDFQTFVASSGLASFRVDNTGTLYVSRTNSAAGKLYPSSDGAGTYASGGSGLFLGMNTGFGSVSNTSAVTTGLTGNWAQTSGAARTHTVRSSFAPTSGTGTVEALNITGTINQTGGANGFFKGFNFTPTLTAYADVRGFSMSTTSTISSATSPLLKGLDIQNTINHTGSVTSSNYTDLFINDTETSLTGTTHNFADWQIGGTSRFKVRNSGLLVFDTTITAGGTTGNQTINKPTGTVNIAAAGTAVTVTNSVATASSTILATARTNDTTCMVKNVVPGAGSFVINMTAACTAETSVGFLVINE